MDEILKTFKNPCQVQEFILEGALYNVLKVLTKSLVLLSTNLEQPPDYEDLAHMTTINQSYAKFSMCSSG